MFSVAPLLLLFPLIGVVFNGLFGRNIVANDREAGEKITGWFAALMSLAAFAVTIILWVAARADHHAHVVHMFDWINIESAGFHVPWALHIDTLSVTMLLIITGVGSLIHIYAIGYMHGDENFSRFFTYLNLFMFFMILVVTGSSYLTLFVGWEGVGLASFLLIGFWFSKDGIARDGDRDEDMYEGVVNSNAARKAFVVNRFGDLFMILAMCLTFWTFGTLDFGTSDHHGVFQLAVEMFENKETVQLGTSQVPVTWVLSLITFFLLLGATGKSAQLPFFIWLPDAMAGPTPVSALMHAATMVTSGIYLLVRSNVFLEIVREAAYKGMDVAIHTPNAIALFGAATALYAGLIAFTQFDIKKVLAYSTVSQLGFMIAAVGMGAYVAAMFHLVTHAFFKALLFMGAGSVIHGMEHGHHHIHDHHHGDDEHAHHPGEDKHDDFDPQDMRFMGGLLKKMPITGYTYIIGSLALAGIFPFAGFWSKDEILAHVPLNAEQGGIVFTIVYWLLTAAAVCTAFYMGRQLKMVFFGSPRHEAVDHVPESVPTMTGPLVALAILSIVGGFLINLPFFTEAAYKNSEGYGMQLILEHWLEHSIASFELKEEGIVKMPKAPTVLNPTVAGVSTVLAVGALIVSFFVVYGKTQEKPTDKDPLIGIPPFSIMKLLPVNTLYSKVFRNMFNEGAYWTGHTLDWAFYHDFVHEKLLRGTYYAIANFLNGVFDRHIIDGGMVLGMGRLVRGTSNLFKQMQTGYVRNYAFSLFIGVVALLAYFVLVA